MSTQSLLLRHGAIEQPICFATATAGPPAAEYLSETEQARAARFQFAAKREGFLLGRLAAKRALGTLLGESDLRQIEIRSGIYGQPIVRHRRADSVQVSISHSHGLAVALAFPADVPMGIDLETVSAASAATILAELQASSAEQAWLAASGVDEATACGVLWTAREALGKALRIGLNGPLGILALAGVRSADDGTWSGRYLNFPRCQCLAQASGERVLSLALPVDAALGARLRFP